MKKVWAITGIFFLAVVFVEPLRDYMNGLFRKGQVKEEQVVGAISDYNPRIRDVQELLREKGYYKGLVDGFVGEQTRKAVKKIQKEKGLKATGRIDSETLAALDLDKEKEARPPLVSEKKEVSNPPEAVKEAQNAGDAKMDARQVQRALSSAGFYKGKIDGKTGPLTKKAIMIFQKENGLKADGVAGKSTWMKLKEFQNSPSLSKN